MRSIVISCLFTAFSLCILSGQTDMEKVEATINRFIEGTVYNYPEIIESAFYPEAEMYLYNTADTILRLSPKEYAAYYDNGRRGQENARPSTIIEIKLVLDVAYALLQVDIPSFGNRFNDMLLLKKIDGEWLIVAKVTSAGPLPLTAMEHKPRPEKEVIMSGLKKPWSMAFISEDLALLAEKDGDLLLVNLKEKTNEKVTGLPTDVGRAVLIDLSEYPKGIYPDAADGNTTSYNAGWFEVLLDPNYSKNKMIYLSYAAMQPDKKAALKVIRGVLDGNKLTNVQTIFEAGPYMHGLFHFGGGMTFGTDSMLYIATGERNFFEYMNPEIPIAQDVKDARGKIIRIHPDGTIPQDNPDFGRDAVAGLYATGIRATQGLFSDKETGEIWFTDHGTMQGDEFNKLIAGANYGWPNKTSGKFRTKDYVPAELNNITFTAPIHYWDQTIAPTGLLKYTGREFMQWKGDYIIPGLSKGNLWRLSVDQNDTVTSIEELFPYDHVRLRKAVQSPRGYLYILTDEEDGKIIKVKNGK